VSSTAVQQAPGLCGRTSRRMIWACRVGRWSRTGWTSAPTRPWSGTSTQARRSSACSRARWSTTSTGRNRSRSVRVRAHGAGGDRALGQEHRRRQWRWAGDLCGREGQAVPGHRGL